MLVSPVRSTNTLVLIKHKYNNDLSFGSKTPILKEVNPVSATTKLYDNGLQKILKSVFGLSKKNIKELEQQKTTLQQQIENAQEQLLLIGRLLDYDKLRKSGFTKRQIRNFAIQDDNIIKDTQKIIVDKNEATKHYFGYPINLDETSAVCKYLEQKELELPLLNNCADTYEQGNSRLNSKDLEKQLLNKLYKHFGLEEPTIKDVYNPITKKFEKTHTGAWGYITSGGSESNRWGIENGLKKFPDGHIYYSSAAHYSVDKVVNIGTGYNGRNIEKIEHTVIQTQQNSEKIDTEILLNTIQQNWEEKRKPAVILLTWGTTKTGTCDDIKTISKTLVKKNIPHYIHLDAALSGGIPKNQIQAPQIPDIKNLGVDSVSVSLHKYFGHKEVKSAVIAQEKPKTISIDYIGQDDGTTAGSRAHRPFSTLQKVREVLDRSYKKKYAQNIIKFEKLLKKYKIPYTRESKSNTFVIDKPSNEICKYYQLSTFKLNEIDTQTGKTVSKEKAHIIIFPSHQEDIMEQLVKDLGKSKN